MCASIQHVESNITPKFLGGSSLGEIDWSPTLIDISDILLSSSWVVMIRRSVLSSFNFKKLSFIHIRILIYSMELRYTKCIYARTTFTRLLSVYCFGPSWARALTSWRTFHLVLYEPPDQWSCSSTSKCRAASPVCTQRLACGVSGKRSSPRGEPSTVGCRCRQCTKRAYSLLKDEITTSALLFHIS